jgi:hypothetical protein
MCSIVSRSRLFTLKTMVMANRLVNLQRQLFARSERVKGIDFHPTGSFLLYVVVNANAMVQNHGSSPRSTLAMFTFGPTKPAPLSKPLR